MTNFIESFYEYKVDEQTARIFDLTLDSMIVGDMSSTYRATVAWANLKSQADHVLPRKDINVVFLKQGVVGKEDQDISSLDAMNEVSKLPDILEERRGGLIWPGEMVITPVRSTISETEQVVYRLVSMAMNKVVEPPIRL